MQRQWIGCAGIALALAVTGLPAHAQQMPQQVAQAAPNAVLASAQFADDPDLRCDLLEVKRVSGGALMVRWRTVNAAGQSVGAGGFASTSGGEGDFLSLQLGSAVRHRSGGKQEIHGTD